MKNLVLKRAQYYRITLRMLLLGSICNLVGCGPKHLTQQDSAPSHPKSLAHIRDAIPKSEPKSVRGNPNRYTVRGKTYRVRHTSHDYRARGIASWYGTKFHGRKTSSGEPYDMYKMTAAHKTLPLPTYVRVTNLTNQRAVILKVNDRGPFVDQRLIDLSYAAAAKLGVLKNGTALVEVEALDPKQYPANAKKPVTQSNYLQVGAFTEKCRARALAKELLALGHEVHVHRGDQTAAHPLYRVQIGPLANQQIKTLSKQMTSLTDSIPLLVQR